MRTNGKLSLGRVGRRLRCRRHPRTRMGLVQPEGIVDRFQRTHTIVFIDQDRDFDVAGRDHLNVDFFTGKSRKDLLGNARDRSHPSTDDRDFAHIFDAAHC